MKILNIFLTVFLVFTFITTSIHANSNEKKEFSQNAVENLIMAIKSDNIGLKKSAVYLAGKYKIEATTEALINQLDNVENESVKKLIIMSLYEINVDSNSKLVEEFIAKE
ncbi:MAG: hypothetical protein PVH88_11910 [Ignavibacteria bacterium]